MTDPAPAGAAAPTGAATGPTETGKSSGSAETTRSAAPAGPEPHPALRTKFCDLVGIRYPVVQTGMGWVAGPRLTAATSAAGGLGILASATMTLDQLKAAVADVKSRTDKPFGVNLLTSAADSAERVSFMIEQGVKVASFAQAPKAEMVARCREAGVVVIPTIGARRHAEKVAEWGVHGVIAQGGEGGGHTGTIPTSLLLPQVVDAVGDRIVVLGAGGYFDGRGLVAALAYGAHGIAMGTRFLLTQESRVPDEVKKIYLGTAVTGTVVTTAIDGAPQRVIRTEVIDHLEGAGKVAALPRAAKNALAFRKETGASVKSLLQEGLAMKKAADLTWAQMVMAANAPMMTKAAMVDGRTDIGILPTGQVVGTIEELPTVAELVHRIVIEANATLARLGA